MVHSSIRNCQNDGHDKTDQADQPDDQGQVDAIVRASHPAARRDHEWGKFAAFFQGADLLLHGWEEGLSWECVVDLAAAAQVKQLVFLPVRETQLTVAVQARAASQGSGLKCLGPAAGQCLIL